MSLDGANKAADEPANKAAEEAEVIDAAALYTSHVHRVARWAERLAGPSADLEDIVHEVFSVVHRQWQRFRHESSVATWLFGITANVVRQRRRKERWGRWLKGSAEEVAGDVLSDAPDPSRLVERDETRRLVYRLLDQIPERDRQVIILFELEELSAEEVGTLLRIKPANARLRLHRARTRFLRAYERLEGDAARKERSLAQSESV